MRFSIVFFWFALISFPLFNPVSVRAQCGQLGEYCCSKPCSQDADCVSNDCDENVNPNICRSTHEADYVCSDGLFPRIESIGGLSTCYCLNTQGDDIEPGDLGDSCSGRCINDLHCINNVCRPPPGTCKELSYASYTENEVKERCDNAGGVYCTVDIPRSSYNQLFCCTSQPLCESIGGKPSDTQSPSRALDIYCASGGINTAIGCIPTESGALFTTLFETAVGIAGGIAFLLILYGALMIIISSGHPEKIAEGREIISAAITGLLLIIFSVFLLQLLGVDILGIPDFK